MELLWGAGLLFGHGADDELETCVVWEAGALGACGKPRQDLTEMSGRQ